MPSKILQSLLSPFFASHSLIKARSLPINWSVLTTTCVRRRTKKILNLALPVQIPYHTLAKVKFPTPGKAFCVKFPTPLAQKIVKCLAGFYLGFIVWGEKSRVAKGHELPKGVRGHAPRKCFEMNIH